MTDPTTRRHQASQWREQESSASEAKLDNLQADALSINWEAVATLSHDISCCPAASRSRIIPRMHPTRAGMIRLLRLKDPRVAGRVPTIPEKRRRDVGLRRLPNPLTSALRLKPTSYEVKQHTDEC